MANIVTTYMHKYPSVIFSVKTLAKHIGIPRKAVKSYIYSELKSKDCLLMRAQAMEVGSNKYDKNIYLYKLK